MSDRHATVSGVMISRLSGKNTKIFAKLSLTASLIGIGAPQCIGACVKIAAPTKKQQATKISAARRQDRNHIRGDAQGVQREGVDKLGGAYLCGKMPSWMYGKLAD